MTSSLIARFIFLASVLFGLMGLSISSYAGSSGEPLKFTERDEIPEGPGLFSKGSTDGLVIFSSYGFGIGKGKKESDAAYAEPENAQVTRFEEFEAFKKLQESGEDTVVDDYKTFQEYLQWKEWKEYQEWKKSQTQ